MARTPLFRIVTRALSRSARSHAPSGRPHTALTRRRMLLLSGAAAGTAVLGSRLSLPAYSRDRKAASVGIVGGGVAGLTAAYRLSQQGIRPVLYEASNRFGGRMFTRRDFHAGMFCELGGELVDTNHADLSALADELGLELQPLAGEREGDDLYHFGGKLYTPRDMLDAETGQGAFVPIAEQIARDAGQLLDASEDWTEHARALDGTSLKAYLEQFRGKAPDWAIDLIEIAYLGEFGLPLADQSALNMVDFIGTDLAQPFQIFGESDEAYRIKGGSSALIDALVKALDGRCEMRLGHALSRIGANDAGLDLEFQAGGKTVSANHGVMVLALPFTRLRDVAGLDTLGLTDGKREAIRSLGYGNNAKLMIGTRSRAWRADAAGLPAPSNGSFYSDLPFQNVWETSRAQPGAQGILTNFLAGTPADGEEGPALAALRDGLRALNGAIADSLDARAVTSFFWSRHPYTKGSYASARVGQYTTLLEATATPELDGRLQFAGEHTSSDFLGYMNGGVESGNRVAAAIAEVVKARASQ